MRKSIGIYLLFLVGFMCCLFCIIPKSGFAGEVRGITDNTIKLGVILDQTGPGANVAVMMTRAIKNAVRYANEQGGVHNRKITISVEDDRYNIPLALGALKKLVHRDRVLALLGPSSSGGVTALCRNIQKAKIPTISPIMPEVTVNPFKRYVFIIADIYPNQIKVLLDYVIKDVKPKGQKIAIVYPDNEAGKVDLKSALKTLKTYNLKPVSKEVLNPGAFDASSQVMSLKRVKPDAILLCGFIPQNTIVLLRDMKKYGFSVPVFGSWATCAEEVINMTGDASKKWWAVNAMSSWYDDGPGLARMREITLSYYPGTEKPYRGKLYTHAWVMATLMLEGLKRAGRDIDGESLVEAIENIRDFDTGGLTGAISYSSTSHKGGNSWKIFKADPGVGKFRPVTGWRKAE